MRRGDEEQLYDFSRRLSIADYLPLQAGGASYRFPVERFDHPAVARVEADMPGPP